MLTLSQNIAQLEAEVEKITREKISAVHQLEEIQNQLASREMDVTEVQREIRKEKRREIIPIAPYTLRVKRKATT